MRLKLRERGVPDGGGRIPTLMMTRVADDVKRIRGRYCPLVTAVIIAHAWRAARHQSTSSPLNNEM